MCCAYSVITTVLCWVQYSTALTVLWDSYSAMSLCDVLTVLWLQYCAHSAALTVLEDAAQWCGVFTVLWVQYCAYSIALTLTVLWDSHSAAKRCTSYVHTPGSPCEILSRTFRLWNVTLRMLTCGYSTPFIIQPGYQHTNTPPVRPGSPVYQHATRCAGSIQSHNQVRLHRWVLWRVHAQNPKFKNWDKNWNQTGHGGRIGRTRISHMGDCEFEPWTTPTEDL